MDKANNISDELLKAKAGNKDPFVVPEGYFEGLTAQIMDKLPEKKSVKSIPLQPNRRKTLLRWTAAACIAGIVAIGGFGIQRYMEPAVGDAAEMAFDDDEYMDEALDYMMLNNNDIATYLTMGE